jgi:hypothetical protein
MVSLCRPPTNEDSQMMNDDPEIAARLQMPTPICEPMTVINLVRRHYSLIQSARHLDPPDRKTWDQIGRDLRPPNPFQGGTVGRAFARVTAERSGLGQRRSKAARAASQLCAPAPNAPAPAAAQEKMPTLFSRVIDPIRLSDWEEA